MGAHVRTLERRRWPISLVRGVEACLLLVLVLLAPQRVEAGDPTVAEFLLKAGREALEKGNYDDAFSKLKKSAEEALNEFEVQYWLGLTCEKRDDKTLAVGYYRLFLTNVESATKAGVLPGNYHPLAKKARARLEVLAAALLDRVKIDEGAAAKFVALARKHQASNPEAARRAARWAWRLVGDSEDVLALLKDLDEDPRPKEMGPVSDLGGLEQPLQAFTDLPEVKTARGILYPRLLGRFDTMTWDKGVAMIDCPASGILAWPAVEQTIGARFVVELEARLLAPNGAKWAIGAAFGARDAFYAVFFAQGQVVVTRSTTSAGFTDVTGMGLASFDLGAWHRLTVRGDGAQLTVWFDGKQVIDHKLPESFTSATGVGLWYQTAKFEVRTLRTGSLR